MKTTTALSLVLLLALVLDASASGPNFFPCHPNSRQMGTGVTCKQVQLPPTLCTACPLRAPTDLGGFKQCWNIYDTKAPGCFDALKSYAAANPCDPVRRAMVTALEADPNDGSARNVADYFLYAVCEQCCDCVPMGSNDKLYDTYAAAGTLMDAYRGNCPAHAFYDICKIFPVVEAITPIGAAMPADAVPACGTGSELDKWFNSPASQRWESNPKTTLSAPLKRFLDGMLEAAVCTDRKQWMACHDLEERQNKLGEITPIKQDVQPINGTSPSPALSAAASAAPSAAPSVAASAPSTTESNVAAVPSPSTVPSVTTDTTITTAPDSAPASDPSSSPAGAIDGSAPDTVDTQPDSAAPPNLDNVGPDTNTELTAPPLALGALPTLEPDAGQCFPASATVLRADGATVRMDALRVGDLVHVGDNHYEPVFMFSHADAQTVAVHVRITLADERQITLTPGHLLHEGYAGDVRIGHRVDGAVVTRVERVYPRGLYNPNTSSGNIVVDGVRATTFTSFVDPKAAQAWLAPLRALAGLGVNPLSVATHGVHRLLW